jgi:hypothetical protein
MVGAEIYPPQKINNYNGFRLPGVCKTYDTHHGYNGVPPTRELALPERHLKTESMKIFPLRPNRIHKDQ